MRREAEYQEGEFALPIYILEIRDYRKSLHIANYNSGLLASWSRPVLQVRVQIWLLQSAPNPCCPRAPRSISAPPYIPVAKQLCPYTQITVGDVALVWFVAWPPPRPDLGFQIQDLGLATAAGPFRTCGVLCMRGPTDPDPQAKQGDVPGAGPGGYDPCCLLSQGTHAYEASSQGRISPLLALHIGTAQCTPQDGYHITFQCPTHRQQRTSMIGGRDSDKWEALDKPFLVRDRDSGEEGYICYYS